MKEFIKTLDNINNTHGKIAKQSILSEYLNTLNIDHKVIVAKILLNDYVTNVGPKQIKPSNGQISLFQYDDLTLEEFWDILMKLSHSRSDNQLIINELYNRSSNIEKTYINKILLNNLNIGVSTATVLDSFGIEDIRRKYYICTDIKKILTGNYKGVELFSPTYAMLAKSDLPIPDNFVCEYKYDGYRALFHKKGSEWHIYSRLREDVSSREFGIGVMLLEKLGSHDVILDMEIISTDMNFQHAMRDSSIRKPIVFDILLFDGESLVDKPLKERRKYLEKLNIEITDQFTDIEETFNRAILGSYEGIVIKDLDQIYLPNERKWIKMKKSVDTADLLVVGATKGEGKRENLYGAFVLGALINDEITEICKVGSGFSDEDLRKLHLKLYPYEVIKGDTIYFEGNPDIVMEIEYFEVTKSPSYPGGISLRFPVFKKIRNDKNKNDISELKN